MPYTISEDDIRSISDALAAAPVHDGDTIRFELVHEERRLVLEIQPSLSLPDVPESEPVGLVSVYGMNSFLQLHGVTGILASAELGEVIFFARRTGTTSGLVVEKAAGAVNKSIFQVGFALVGKIGNVSDTIRSPKIILRN